MSPLVEIAEVSVRLPELVIQTEPTAVAARLAVRVISAWVSSVPIDDELSSETLLAETTGVVPNVSAATILPKLRRRTVVSTPTPVAVIDPIFRSPSEVSEMPPAAVAVTDVAPKSRTGNVPPIAPASAVRAMVPARTIAAELAARMAPEMLRMVTSAGVSMAPRSSTSPTDLMKTDCFSLAPAVKVGATKLPERVPASTWIEPGSPPEPAWMLPTDSV